jgi:hypothetical protein
MDVEQEPGLGHALRPLDGEHLDEVVVRGPVGGRETLAAAEERPDLGQRHAGGLDDVPE